jgi:hypothetical protein
MGSVNRVADDARRTCAEPVFLEMPLDGEHREPEGVSVEPLLSVLLLAGLCPGSSREPRTRRCASLARDRGGPAGSHTARAGAARSSPAATRRSCSRWRPRPCRRSASCAQPPDDLEDRARAYRRRRTRPASRSRRSRPSCACGYPIQGPTRSLARDPRAYGL